MRTTACVDVWVTPRSINVIVADLDIISQKIRNQIISAKDVNSNLLLIPNYESPIKRKDHDDN
jgi:hypothetical protein